MRDFLRYRLPAVLWMLLIFFLSSIPKNDLPDIDFPYVHLFAHFIEYSVLGFLLMRSFTHSLGSDKKSEAGVAALILVILFACSDEYHQTFVAGRSGQVITVIYDAIFSILGVGFFLLLRKKK